jgi:hypothetical protein
MPLDLDQSDRVIRVRAFGSVNCAESLDLVRSLLRQSPVLAGRPIFVDARGVTDAPSTRELRRIATEMMPFATAGFGAIGILTESICIYGIARMFSVLAEAAAHVSAFRDPREAAEWLDCQPRPHDSPPAGEVIEALLRSGAVEREGERRAAPGLALDGEIAVHGAREFAADSQAESRPG